MFVKLISLAISNQEWHVSYWPWLFPLIWGSWIKENILAATLQIKLYKWLEEYRIYKRKNGRAGFCSLWKEVILKLFNFFQILTAMPPFPRYDQQVCLSLCQIVATLHQCNCTDTLSDKYGIFLEHNSTILKAACKAKDSFDESSCVFKSKTKIPEVTNFKLLFIHHIKLK